MPGLVEVDKWRRSLKETWRRHSRIDAAPPTVVEGWPTPNFAGSRSEVLPLSELGQGDSVSDALENIRERERLSVALDVLQDRLQGSPLTPEGPHRAK